MNYILLLLTWGSSPSARGLLIGLITESLVLSTALLHR